MEVGRGQVVIFVILAGKAMVAASLERCGERRYRPPPLVVSVFSDIVLLREVVYMERPIELIMGHIWLMYD